MENSVTHLYINEENELQNVVLVSNGFMAELTSVRVPSNILSAITIPEKYRPINIREFYTSACNPVIKITYDALVRVDAQGKVTVYYRDNFNADWIVLSQADWSVGISANWLIL